MRRRVKEAQASIGTEEFGKVDLSFSLAGGPETVVYCDETVQYRLRAESETAGQGKPERSFEPDELPAPDPAEVSSPTSSREYAVGDMIGGRFDVEEILGSGGFSRAYRVRDTVEEEVRALKLFEDAAGYDAVRREIAALRKVQHSNVVEVIWADSTDDGEWYLILEFVEGELLEKYADGTEHLRDREAVDVALDVLSALIAIHPDSERLDELDRRKRDGELSAEEYDELMG